MSILRKSTKNQNEIREVNRKGGFLYVRLRKICK